MFARGNMEAKEETKQHISKIMHIFDVIVLRIDERKIKIKTIEQYSRARLGEIYLFLYVHGPQSPFANEDEKSIKLSMKIIIQLQ